MSYLNVVLKVLLILASLVYIMTDLFFIITSNIPSDFVLIENLVYAIVYSVLFLALIKNSRTRAIIATIVVASFNAGRVSESIVDSLGRVRPLATSHVPLFIGLAVLIIVAFLNLTKERQA